MRKGRKLAAVGVKDLCLKAAIASGSKTDSSSTSSSTTSDANASCSGDAKENPDRRETLSTVEELLRQILDPEKPISDPDNIDWIRHILAGGDSFEDYVAKLKVYDASVTCGFVWTSNFGM